MGEAFDRYIGDAGSAFVITELPSVRDAVEMIRASGGYAVWAHPDPVIFEREIHTFAGYGLAGIECFRPNTPAGDAKRFRAVARELGLWATGGSDWHGPHRSRLGDFFIDAEEVRGLLDADPPG